MSAARRISEINLKNVIMPAPPGMVIDGRFDEWNAIPVAINDPIDANSIVDFRVIKAFSDDRFVYLMIEVGNFVNAQGLDGAAFIFLDVDGHPVTGKRSGGMDGVDAIIELTPPNRDQPGKPGMGVGLRSTAYHPPATMREDYKLAALNTYDIGLLFAPTHQGTRFEFRIDRGARLPDCPPLFLDKQFTFKVTFLNLTGAAEDEAGPFTQELTPTTDPASTAQTPIIQTADPLARAEGTVLRAMSWNIERGAIFKKSDAFARSIKAIAPDVILFQEMTDKNSAGQIQQFLDEHLPQAESQHWAVAFGTAGGDLRCAIASRYPLEAIPSLSKITVENRSGKPAQPARAECSRMIVDGKSVLVTSLHLKCCGRAGGTEDQTRINECKAIHSAIRSVLPGGANAEGETWAGVLMAGDLNLVGSRTPLEMLAIQTDLDKTSLSIVEPYQLDGLSNLTWADRTQPFTPGRLDFMLYSDSTMRVLRAFVYDSADLSTIWAQSKDVKEDDTQNTSDHLPVVTDFAWVE